MEFAKVCVDCKHSYTGADRPELPGRLKLSLSTKLRRCAKSEAKEGDDASLCGMMRQGDICGPTAILWEARDGQA